MQQSQMIISNGKLIGIGGAEEKGIASASKKPSAVDTAAFLEKSILRRIVDEAGGVNARIEIITTASAIPHKVGDQYLESFSKIGCTNIGIIHIRNRKEINTDYVKRISRCDGVMFSGGTQLRLARVFQNTELLNVIIHRYQQEKLLIAGTSAGAMVMGKIMIYKGPSVYTYLKGQVKTESGFGLLNHVIFDSHFEKGGRFARLAQVVAAHRSHLGVGLAEDTGVLITNGNCMQIIGSGLVMIIDGHGIHHTNIADVPDNAPINIENLKVHFCVAGDEYDLSKRKMTGKNILPI